MIEKKSLQEIEKIISESEAKSSCEIVAILTKRSDDYIFIPMLWAALAALLLPALPMALFPSLADDGVKLLLSQWLAFIFLALLFRLDALKMRLIPKSIKHRRAQSMAHLQFISHGLNDEEAPGAILLFISFEERYVQIITNSKVPIENGVWEGVIERLLEEIKRGSLNEGVVKAVKEITEFTKRECPPDENERVNRYPNRLITL